MSTPSPFEVSRGIANNLSGAFQKQRDTSQIEQILTQASNDPQQLNDAIGKILSKVSPERQAPAIAFLQDTMQRIENNKLRQSQAAAATKAGIDPNLSPALQAAQYKAQNQPAKTEKPAPPPKPTPFQTAVQQGQAKSYLAAKEDIPKLDSALKSIDHLEKLADKLSGPTGYIKAAIGSKDASEFDATGLTLIEPIIKIFNPVGAIPVAKINLIKEKFAPKATDTNRTIQGKLNAIRFFTNQAKERAQKKIALIDQYQGNPPPEAIEAFDKESEAITDAMDAYPIKGASEIPAGTIRVQSPTGQTGYMTQAQFDKATKDGAKYVRLP